MASHHRNSLYGGEMKFSRSDQKPQQHQSLSNAPITSKKPQAECIAKSLQRQFPLIRLEQSLLVNGCMNSCPVHGQRSEKNSSFNPLSKHVSKIPTKIIAPKNDVQYQQMMKMLNQHNNDIKNSKNSHNLNTPSMSSFKWPQSSTQGSSTKYKNSPALKQRISEKHSSASVFGMPDQKNKRSKF